MIEGETPPMHVLLAEDDNISRDFLCHIIESGSHKITPAPDGTEAWKQLTESGNSFDACIFDICMPKLSGIQLVERMRAQESLKRIPVILCTAVHDRATVQQAAALGVAHYIIKPYSRAVMLEKLRQISAAAKQQEDVDPLESPEAVCKRLGIDMEFHREMLGNALREGEGFSADLHSTAPDLENLFMRARGLKGSCLTFGIKAAAKRLDQIETLLQKATTAPESVPDCATRLQSLGDELDRDITALRNWLGSAAAVAVA